jgi:cation:H+ antiporter
MWIALMLIAGLILLVAGGELLVRGASRIAEGFGISRLVVGLTVVAFGTSSPELMVTVRAAFASGPAADLALGNVVGSNILNVLLILGLSAVVTPLVVSRALVWREVPLMSAASVLLLVFAWNGSIGRLEGVLFLAGLIAYIVFTVREVRRERPPEAGGGDDAAAETGRPLINALSVLAGLGLLVAGANWFVEGAIGLARLIGLSEVIIGLTIVAVGTSLPELVTSVLASIRGEREIAVGNIVGSNLFNILGVLGVAALVAPTGIPAASSILTFDGPVMLAVAFACLPIFFTGHRIDRWEGFVFLGYYVAYVAYLILDASGHDALPAFSTAMLLFVVPLTLLTLAISITRSLRRRAEA